MGGDEETPEPGKPVVDQVKTETSPGAADAAPVAAEAAPERPDPRLLELLVCPLTKTRLSYDRGRGELISKAAGLAFPIRNGVPMMTLEAAHPLDIDP